MDKAAGFGSTSSFPRFIPGFVLLDADSRKAKINQIISGSSQTATWYREMLWNYWVIISISSIIPFAAIQLKKVLHQYGRCR